MEDYDLDLKSTIEEIKISGAKLVCVQLPDGLKPKAKTIQQEIEKNTKASVIIWMGSCWGGCDVPMQVKKLNVDLIIQWGHSEYIRSW
ncbi:diphthamide synthesis protein [Candidatus Woesearchaeota archaeon]|nr:diphthamide synthesis protein [Candidatus Woesearchaeota archaeon]